MKRKNMADPARVLVVDDDALNTRTLVDILALHGYQADGAISGKEALERLKVRAYDCVLSDIKMPQMNGVQLLEAVKKSHPKTPFILMTAYAHYDLVMEGIRKGVLVTMIKPLEIDRLLANIRQVVSR